MCSFVHVFFFSFESLSLSLFNYYYLVFVLNYHPMEYYARCYLCTICQEKLYNKNSTHNFIVVKESIEMRSQSIRYFSLSRIMQKKKKKNLLG